MIPVIRTERLILRAMTMQDFPRFAEIWREPEVVRFIGAPRSDAESWGTFLRIAGSWALQGFGQWGIERAVDGALIGQVGFFRGMRGFGADFDDALECGWVLTTAAQGQGFGPEAAAAAHGWLDAQAISGKTVAIIEVGHGASLRVAERLGYRIMREVEDDGDRVWLLAREPKGI